MGGLDRAGTRLVSLVHWFHRAPGAARIEIRSQVAWRAVLPVALLGMLIAVVAIGDRVGVPHEFDPTRPFTVGRSWGLVEAVAAHGGTVTPTGGTYGYDGQWFLGLAYDPLLRGEITDTFDAPQYRAQRPLLGMLGWLFAAGRPGAIPLALLVVQLLAVGLGCAAFARIVTAYGRSRWWGAAFLLIPGVVVGVLYGTAEPLGLALVAAGLSLVHDRRYLWAGAAFAGAGLTKETYLGFAAAAATWLAVGALLRGTRRWWPPALAVAVPGAVAFSGWWLYVSVAMPASARAPEQVFAAPFHGWWETFLAIGRDEYRVDYHDHAIGWTGQGLMIATFLVIVVALAAAFWYRQSMLAYSVFIWCPHGLVIVDFLLGRFLSAQRALAPTVLAALLMLLTAPWSRRGAAPDPVPPDRLPRQRSRPPESPAVKEASGALD